MAVLAHPVGRRRKAKRDIEADLTADEQKHVHAAPRFFLERYDSWDDLAAAVGVKAARIEKVARRGTVSAGIALRVARVARAPLEDILAGRSPKPGMRPHCGRG